MKLTSLIAAAALLATPAFATGTGFGIVPAQKADTMIEIPTVRAATDGYVSIYSYHGGDIGALLGSTEVHAGANADVSIGVSTYSANTLIAVLSDNAGNVMDEHVIKLQD